MIRNEELADDVNPRKPRASGDDPTAEIISKEEDEVNPARAGMIRAAGPMASVVKSKPRASGDDPTPPYPADMTRP